jgi:phosphate transport system substrate-binding protein
MNTTLRRVLTATGVAATAFALSAGPALAGVTAHADQYLAFDTQMKNAASIAGGGSSFAAPLQNAAQAAYTARNVNATMAGYQAVGSGSGETGVLNKSFDWGGTDVPMSQSDITAREPGGKSYTTADFLQVPIGLGGVAIAYNLPTIAKTVHLHFTATVLAKIYLGTITKWNDPQIKALNKTVASKLPNHAINYVARADSSGTTYIYTDFLNTAAPTVWTTAPSKSALTLHFSNDLAGTGNAGMASDVAGTKYSIGYVEYSYVLLNPTLQKGIAAVQNKAKAFLVPSLVGIAADASKKPAVSAASHATYSIVYQAGATSYPIDGYTWAVVFAKQGDNNKGTLLVKYLDWLAHSYPASAGKIAGQNIAGQQGYVPLPANIQALATGTLIHVLGTSNQQLLQAHS